jgi:hypothetical protein
VKADESIIHNIKEVAKFIRNVKEMRRETGHG